MSHFSLPLHAERRRFRPPHLPHGPWPPVVIPGVGAGAACGSSGGRRGPLPLRIAGISHSCLRTWKPRRSLVSSSLSPHLLPLILFLHTHAPSSRHPVIPSLWQAPMSRSNLRDVATLLEHVQALAQVQSYLGPNSRPLSSPLSRPLPRPLSRPSPRCTFLFACPPCVCGCEQRRRHVDSC